MQLFKGLEGNSLPDALRPAASRLQAAAHLEAAAAAHDVGRVANGQSHLDTAGSLLGTSFEVTGQLLTLVIPLLMATTKERDVARGDSFRLPVSLVQQLPRELSTCLSCFWDAFANWNSRVLATK